MVIFSMGVMELLLKLILLSVIYNNIVNQMDWFH